MSAVAWQKAQDRRWEEILAVWSGLGAEGLRVLPFCTGARE